MRFTIREAEGYVRGDLYDRETPEETREFLTAVAKVAFGIDGDRILVSNHSSRAIFRVHQFGLGEIFELLASRPAHRIALVADNVEVRMAQQYIAVLAKLKGLNVRSFGAEREAIRWLRE